MKTIESPQKSSATSMLAARVSLIGAAAFLLLLGSLHFLKPDLDPSWHMISEYAIGPFGWIMQIAFLCMAAACAVLIVALFSQARGVVGRIGLVVLVFAAAGMVIAGINVTDPTGTSIAAMSGHGIMHAWGFQIGVPSLTSGLTLLTISLRRRVKASVRAALLWSTVTAWLSLVALGVVFAVLLPAHQGVIESGVVIGWPNRIYMVACAFWIIAVAWNTLQVKK